MAHKLPDIRYKQIGKNLNVVIDDEPITFKGEKETLAPIKEKLDAYIKKKTPALLKEITEAVKPKTTQVAKEKEKKEAELVAEKKSTKKKIKELKEETKEETKQAKKENAPRKAALSSLLIGNVLTSTGTEFTLYGYESVKMPDLLVQRFIDYVQLKHDVQPLVNFWMWCLLNPNKVARYKLFAYLSKHKLLITPSGYFVTYRMVKTTDKPGVFTHARSGVKQIFYKIGEVAKLDRATECDEDGSRDCSRGLHTGSPDFIGIKVGEGYDKGETKTKSQGGGFGTGYDAPKETTQKFNNSFGNQAVICLVNPMHVVSIPNSDTRKMRSCQLFFAKLTTPEEVLSHLTDADYLVFDNEYAQIEAEEIKKMLEGAKLEDYSDGSVEALTGKKDSSSQKKLKALQNKLSSLNGKVLEDKVADDVTQDEMMRIIQSRVKQAGDFYEKPLIERLDTKGKEAASDILGLVGKIAKGAAKSKSATPEIKQRAEELIDMAKKGKKTYDAAIKQDKATSGAEKTASKGKEGKVKEQKTIPSTKSEDAATKKKVSKPKLGIKAGSKEVDNSALTEFVLLEYGKKKKAKKSPKNFWVTKDGDDYKIVESKGEPVGEHLGSLDALHAILNK